MTEPHVKHALQQERVVLHKSNRIDRMALPEIVAISEEAARLRVPDHDVLALSTGEPDFPTPTPVCDAAHRAMQAMIAVQGQITSGASSITQAAAREAVTGDQTHTLERLAAFRMRRDLVVDALNTSPGITCPTPDGAFYVFPSCEAVFGQGTPDDAVIGTDADFFAYVLGTTGLAIVPGRAFGLPGHFRLSYAYACADL